MKRCKVYITHDGKMNFSLATKRMLGLKNGHYIEIATNNDEMQNNLYVRIVKQPSDTAFKIVGGNQLYANTRYLFMSLGEDFENKAIVYHVTDKQVQHEGKQYTLLTYSFTIRKNRMS